PLLYSFAMTRLPPRSPPFPYTTLFRSPEHVLFASIYVGSRAGMQVHRVPISSQRALDRFRFGRKEAMERSVDEAREWFADASGQDRKSTRLNSSHVKISYAVFCLKKKK